MTATKDPNSLTNAQFTILLVDDEPDLLECFSYMLERSGYKVETATGGSEAFKKFQSGSYQMVITDLRMPAGDGISLLKNIRSIDSTTPVLCVTGFSEIPCSEIIQMGANAVLDKPLNTEIIINTIKENLNQIS